MSLVDQCLGIFLCDSRYDTLCLWLYAEPTELRRRLNTRADEMLLVSTHSHQVYYGLRTQNGLLGEVRELTRLQEAPNQASSDTMAPPPANFTHGVFQSIGEFEWTVVDGFVLTRDRLQRISSIPR